jgi:DNA polymerase-4
MQTLRISTIGDLAKYDVQKLIAVFGKKLGVYFHNASLGIDDTPVEEKSEAGSISRIATLKHDTRDVGIVLQKADQLCDEIHARVMQQKLTFKTVGINAVMVDMSIHTRSKTLENATNEAETLRKAVEELFTKLFSETELEARRVGVKVSGFVRGQQGQKQLTSYVNSAT